MQTSDPVVIVTGASRGIGRAVALWLAAKGTAIGLVARNPAALQKTAGRIQAMGSDVLVLEADVAEARACRAAVQKTLQRFSRLDALVNNAGLLEPMTRVADTDPEQYRYNIEVNLLGPVYLTNAALPALRKRKGRVINVSSGAAQTPIAAASAYCASKAALNQFTRVLAKEEPAVTSVAIRPGVVDTPMQELLREQGPVSMPAEQAEYYLGLKRSGQLEPPRVPARSIAWLALHAPHALSGEFVNYDDAAIAQPALTVFGNDYGGR